MAFGLWAGTADETYETAMLELADLGATHVAIVVSWAQRDIRSVAIRPTKDATADDGQLRRAIAAARAAGLQVVVFPILHVQKRKLGEWRGTIAPRDVDTWWRNYERFILHYAAIAKQEGAVGLVVGSELASTETWRQRWFHLLGRVDRAFDGMMIYSANWDHYRSVSFWARVDVIGVTGYFELTDDDDASETELTEAWRARRDQLVEVAAQAGKPLWITEIGYPSRNGSATRPWDYTTNHRVDVEEQRRGYAAFITAWNGVPELGGVLWWLWELPGGPKDGGYSPRGKPAEAAVRRWFTRSLR